MIIVFDLDGTLANIEHRLHLIKDKPKDWPAFFRACVDDKPVPRLISICNDLEERGHWVEIWSGRSDEVRPETEAWLDRHCVQRRVVRMRTAGDYRADDVVKGEWFDNLAPWYRPHVAFDDRQRVVDMWRSRGVICCQVAPGDF